MKTYKKPLFSELISDENLSKAIDNASKYKRDRLEVQKVLANKDKTIKELRRLLVEKQLKFPIRKATEINDGIKAKKRIIVKPPFKYDLIVQWAVVQVLEKIFEKGQYKWSCGSIKGRGIHHGSKYMKRIMKQDPKNARYCAKGDIRHFFQSVDIELLKDMFRKKIRDKDMLEVIFLILDCNQALLHGEIVYVGLPIGYYTSPKFANWFLQSFDHYIKEKLHIKYYARYIDDLVLIGSNKKKLHSALNSCIEYLGKMNLSLKKNYQVFKILYEDNSKKEKGRSIDFLGFQFCKHKTIIRRCVFYRMMRKFARVAKLKVIDIHSARQVVCYAGILKHSNSQKLFKEKVSKLVSIGVCKKIISKNDKKEERNVINMETSRKHRIAS